MCATPYYVHKLERLVPCGKCPVCVKAKLRAWLFRFEQQLKVSYSPLFVTLTYSNDHLPQDKKLSKEDCQLFLKRLRKKYDTLQRLAGIDKMFRLKLKYFLVGEYGSRTKRAHYHLILLNMTYPEIIHDCWGKGHTYSPPLKTGGIPYVLKYISKGREKGNGEFSLISKGIGKNYLTDAVKLFHVSYLENCHHSLNNGAKIPLIKYYKEKLYTVWFDHDTGEITHDYTYMRLEVTDYMAQLAVDTYAKKFKAYKVKHPTYDDEKIHHNLLLAKKTVKFDKRLNEVL